MDVKGTLNLFIVDCPHTVIHYPGEIGDEQSITFGVPFPQLEFIDSFRVVLDSEVGSNHMKRRLSGPFL